MQEHTHQQKTGKSFCLRKKKDMRNYNLKVKCRNYIAKRFKLTLATEGCSVCVLQILGNVY